MNNEIHPQKPPTDSPTSEIVQRDRAADYTDPLTGLLVKGKDPLVPREIDFTQPYTDELTGDTVYPRDRTQTPVKRQYVLLGILVTNTSNIETLARSLPGDE